jgi:hypothetical protein
VAGCIHTEEGEVKGVIGDLVTAINDQDRAAAATLFTGRRLDPVMPNGDSSAIYRLMFSSEGTDFESHAIEAQIQRDSAETTFYLTGKVKRSDTVAGTMMIKLHLNLERVDGEWKIISGSERQLPGG